MSINYYTRSDGRVEMREILAQFESFGPVFPEAALREAMVRKEEITPQLLQLLADFNENAREEGKEFNAQLYAIYLLAFFREERAYPLLAEAVAGRSEFFLDKHFGDLITEDLPKLLASVSGGDLTLLKTLAEDQGSTPDVRDAALRAMVVLFVQGELSRDQLVAYFQSFAAKLERNQQDRSLWSYFADTICIIHPEELYPQLKKAFAADLIDPFFINLEDVNRHLKESKEEVFARLTEDPHYRWARDPITEMGWWACFQPEAKHDVTDPCPCGSGEQYQSCCSEGLASPHFKMEPEEIVRQLKRQDSWFPRAALKAAVAQQKELTPHLLEILKEFCREPEQFSERYYGHLYAIYLLAYFRETLAYPLVVEAVTGRSNDFLEQYFGDTITEDFPRILASVCGGDLGPIKKLAESEENEAYVRDVALGALVMLYARDELSREELIAYFSSLFGKLGDSPADKDFWPYFIVTICEIHPQELYPRIVNAFAADLVDPAFQPMDDVEEALAFSVEETVQDLKNIWTYFWLKDPILELERWAPYNPLQIKLELAEMELGEIIEGFGELDSDFALSEIVARQKEAIPLLLEMLEDFNETPELYIDNNKHLLALFVLAYFKEPRAYPLVVKAVQGRPYSFLKHYFGAIITEDLHRILASVSGGDLSLILELAEDKESWPFVRDAAVRALVVLYAEDELSRSELIAHFEDLFAKLEWDPEDYIFWSCLVGTICDIHPGELFGRVEEVFAAGLIDPVFIQKKDVVVHLEESSEDTIRDLKANNLYSFIGVPWQVGWF